ncbi:MAG: PilZ domain-containing protein [Candidatus Omnitrophota bacterium]
MEEKRRFSRWGLDSSDKAYVDLEGRREEVQIIDISIKGMKVIANRPIGKDKEVTGEFKILPNIGSFFVKGKSVWAVQKDNLFESGIEFEKVSTLPLAA